MFGQRPNHTNIPLTSHDDVGSGEDLGANQDQQANNQIPNQSLRDQADHDAKNSDNKAPIETAGDANPENALNKEAEAKASTNTLDADHAPNTADKTTPNATPNRAVDPDPRSSDKPDEKPKSKPKAKKKSTPKKRSHKKKAPATKECPDCNGSGLKDHADKGFDSTGLCDKCDGSGQVKK